MIGAGSDALNLAEYADALLRQALIAPDGFVLARTVILSALALGAAVLFVLTFVRRSGTAAAGFALVALTGLSTAVLFGALDFLTMGTTVIIACLTASALLLFVNAVLHTGRENLLIAGVSAIVIGVLLSLGALTAVGLEFAAQAQLAILGSVVLSACLLVYGLVKHLVDKGFLGASILLAILASFLMTGAAQSVLGDYLPVFLPLILAAAGILLATLAAPFFGDEVRVPSRRDRMEAEASLMPTSLFDDDENDMPVRAPRSTPAHAAPDTGSFLDRVAPAEPDVAETEEVPAPPPKLSSESTGRRDFFKGSSDPYSSAWSQAGDNGSFSVDEDEYIWDNFARLEVQCGPLMKELLGARSVEELTPEGIRMCLAPGSLTVFDEEVLGGGDPSSGPFDVQVESAVRRFRFTGRRQVDHEGILTRIQARAEPLAGGGRTEEEHFGQAEAEPKMVRVEKAPVFPPVVRLSDGKIIGLEINDPRARSNEEAVRTLIDRAGVALAKLIAEEPRSGVFALIDFASLDVKAGAVASAVGKTVRTHNLPRGALVVGFPPANGKNVKEIAAAAEDIIKAGGGYALSLDDPNAKPGKLKPNMVWISVIDTISNKRARKSAIQSLAKRFGCPVVLQDIKDDLDHQEAIERGATFGTGRAFAFADGDPAKSDSDGSPVVPFQSTTLR